MKPRYLQAQQTTGQSITSGADRLMQWDAPSVNTAGFTESSDVFTATVAGLYLVSFFHYNSYVSSGTVVVDVYKNGATYSQMRTVKTAIPSYGIGLQCWIELAVGDTIAFYVNQAGTGTSSTDTTWQLTMELL